MSQRVATRDSWQTIPISSSRAELRFVLRLTIDEFERVKRGNIPEEMGDKWFAFHDDARSEGRHHYSDVGYDASIGTLAQCHRGLGFKALSFSTRIFSISRCSELLAFLRWFSPASRMNFRLSLDDELNFTPGTRFKFFCNCSQAYSAAFSPV